MKEAYRCGYNAAKQGQMINANPYDCNKTANKYAWLGGYNDYLNGHKLDLTVFK